MQCVLCVCTLHAPLIVVLWYAEVCCVELCTTSVMNAPSRLHSVHWILPQTSPPLPA